MSISPIRMTQLQKLEIMEQMEIEAERKELEERLKKEELVVTFTKVNGDERVMHCTLQENVIPKPEKKEPLSQKKIRKINPEVLSVWDTKAKGWRGFRIDSIKNVTTPNKQKE